MTPGDALEAVGLAREAEATAWHAARDITEAWQRGQVEQVPSAQAAVEAIRRAKDATVATGAAVEALEGLDLTAVDIRTEQRRAVVSARDLLRVVSRVASVEDRLARAAEREAKP